MIINVSVSVSVSVIVTVYNLEHEIYADLLSISKQYFLNFEVIVVDDGSKDNSNLIISDFCKRDSRFSLFCSKNGGGPQARKYGLDNSKGEYIMFIDGDDELPINSLNNLYKHIDVDNIDLVVGSYVTIFKNKTIHHKYKEDIFDGFELAQRLVSGKIMGSPCMKLYNKNLFSSNSFRFAREILRGEDLLMNLEICQRVKKVKIIEDIVYHYMLRMSSTMNSFITTLEYESRYRDHLHEIISSYDMDEIKRKEFKEILHLAEIKALLYAFYSNIKNGKTHDVLESGMTYRILKERINCFQFLNMGIKFNILYLIILFRVPNNMYRWIFRWKKKY